MLVICPNCALELETNHEAHITLLEGTITHDVCPTPPADPPPEPAPE